MESIEYSDRAKKNLIKKILREYQNNAHVGDKNIPANIMVKCLPCFDYAGYMGDRAIKYYKLHLKIHDSIVKRYQCKVFYLLMWGLKSSGIGNHIPIVELMWLYCG